IAICIFLQNRPDIRTVGPAGAICGARCSTGAPARWVSGGVAQWCPNDRNSPKGPVHPCGTGSYCFRCPIKVSRTHFTVGWKVVNLNGAMGHSVRASQRAQSNACHPDVACQKPIPEEVQWFSTRRLPNLCKHHQECESNKGRIPQPIK